MIPVCLITGFLGSGKTTLIEKWIKQYPNNKFVYLINEFCQIDIDGQRLALPANQLVTIAGGSIFCRCLVSDFIRSLRKIETHFMEEGMLPEGVIIEASGVADPGVIQTLLQETKLDQVYQITKIIDIIEPGNFLKLIHTLPNILRQAEASNCILLNKADLYPADIIKKAVEEIREINPHAEIAETRFCDIDLFPFDLGILPKEGGEYAVCRDPNYANISILHDQPLDWLRLKAEIEAIPGAVYRVKGFIFQKNLWWDIDFASDIWHETPLADSIHKDKNQLVVITEGVMESFLETILSSIKSGAYNL